MAHANCRPPAAKETIADENTQHDQQNGDCSEQRASEIIIGRRCMKKRLKERTQCCVDDECGYPTEHKCEGKPDDSEVF